jgi:hypothetical protein
MLPRVPPMVSLATSVLPSLIEDGASSAVQVLPDTVQPLLASEAVLQVLVPPLAQDDESKVSEPALQL